MDAVIFLQDPETSDRVVHHEGAVGEIVFIFLQKDGYLGFFEDHFYRGLEFPGAPGHFQLGHNPHFLDVYQGSVGEFLKVFVFKELLFAVFLDQPDLGPDFQVQFRILGDFENGFEGDGVDRKGLPVGKMFLKGREHFSDFVPGNEQPDQGVAGRERQEIVKRPVFSEMAGS